MTYRCTACQTDEHPREAHTDLHKAIDAMYRAFERKDWNGLRAWIDVAENLARKDWNGLRAWIDVAESLARKGAV